MPEKMRCMSGRCRAAARVSNAASRRPHPAEPAQQQRAPRRTPPAPDRPARRRQPRRPRPRPAPQRGPPATASIGGWTACAHHTPRPWQAPRRPSCATRRSITRSATKWPRRRSNTPSARTFAQAASAEASAGPDFLQRDHEGHVEGEIERHAGHADPHRRAGVPAGEERRHHDLDHHESRQPHRISLQRAGGQRDRVRRERAAPEQHGNDRVGGDQQPEGGGQRQHQRVFDRPVQRDHRRCGSLEWTSRDNVGSRAVPTATPRIPSGSWFTRSA